MNQKLHVLLIEDDADDVELLQDAFVTKGIVHTMHVINDGGLVTSYLHANKEYPDIIVMDLNLPKVHGKEILKEIKSVPVYDKIPVVILTTSSSPEDKKYTLSLGADDYLIKPTTTIGLYNVVSVITKIAAHV